VNEISISQYKRARYFKIYYLSFLVWFPLSQHDRTVRLTYQSREGEGGGGGSYCVVPGLIYASILYGPVDGIWLKPKHVVVEYYCLLPLTAPFSLFLSELL